MLGVFAEFERAMLVERVQAGLRRARAQGKRLGRPRVGEKVEAAIRRELAKGRGIHAVARAVGVGVGTVQRVRSGTGEGITMLHGRGLLPESDLLERAPHVV